MSTWFQRLVLLAAAATLFGCATARPVTGDYSDPHTIEIVNDHFSESDLQLIADRMAASMASSPVFAQQSKGPARVIVTHLDNKTSESIDLESLADKIQVALFKTGKFQIFDQRARVAIAREYEYQQSNYVDATQAHAPGQQLPVDYVITGTLASMVEQGGSDERVYYKMSLQASDMSSGAVKWADEQELRKALVITGISPQTSNRLKIAGYGTAIGAGVVGAGLLFAGFASGVGDDQVNVPCSQVEAPFATGTCTEAVPKQANSTLEWTGAGLMIAAPVVAILTAVLVPEGNPRLATDDRPGLFQPHLAQVGLGVNPLGGGNLVLGGSF